MTGKPRDIGAFLKNRRAQIGKRLAEATEKLAELEVATEVERELLREIERLGAEIAEFKHALDKALNWPPNEAIRRDWVYERNKQIIKGVPKFKRRPTKWKGRDGYEFVSGILAIQTHEDCTVAEAIRKLKKAAPAKWCEEERDLARRYSEIKDYWVPWVRWEMRLEAMERDLLAKIELRAKAGL